MVILNSADNITVYTPLFATSQAWELRVTLIVFYILIGFWCCFGYALIRVPHIAKAISQWGHYVVPAMFIAIGAVIMWDDGCINLIWQLASKYYSSHAVDS